MPFITHSRSLSHTLSLPLSRPLLVFQSFSRCGWVLVLSITPVLGLAGKPCEAARCGGGGGLLPGGRAPAGARPHRRQGQVNFTPSADALS